MPSTRQQWSVGDAAVTAIVEDQTDGIPPQFFFPDATADDIRSESWLGAGYAAADGTVALRVQAFLVQLPDYTVLVDPCVGNGKRRMLPFWNELRTPWRDRFAATGVSPEQIDLVVHTHLHADHVGWDTMFVDGRWQPFFTNARHLYIGEELDYWRAGAQRVAEDVYADSVAPIFDAGLADIVKPTADLGHGLRLLSTPGHTPGHVSLDITCGAERMVISGDLIHHPVQSARPLWAEIGDSNPRLATETRRAFLDEHGAAGTAVAGTHFPSHPVGRIEPDAGTWRFCPLD